MVSMTAEELARRIDGRVEGDGAVVIKGLAGLEDAGEGDLTFLASPRYGSLLARTKAAAVIVDGKWEGACSCTRIRVGSPDHAMAAAAALFRPPDPPDPEGVHASAVVAADAVLAEGVSIGPHVLIETGVTIGARTVIGAGCFVGRGTSIGADCRLYPHVSVRERVRIGGRVIVHCGAVIGSDGFGYVPEKDGRWTKVPQMGSVEIGDDVEIGANVTIDRARFGRTVIERGVKIDNLVQIAHNVRVGEHTAIAAQVGIAGSARIGGYVRIGGQAGVVGHVDVGDGSVVAAKAGVTKDVAPRTFVSGFPAMPHNKERRMHAHMMRLPELKERVDRIEKSLGGIGGAADSVSGA